MSIWVQPDKSYYFAGETVTGNVYLNMQQNFPGASIKLKIKGWESVKWIQMDYIQENPNDPNSHPDAIILAANDIDVTDESSDSDEVLPKNKPQYIRKPNGHLYRVIRHVGDRKVMKEKITLYKWNEGIIPAGQYIFPFSFKLNDQWPGSYSDKKPKSRARIKYELKAICEFPQDRQKELKHKIELMVHEICQIKAEIRELEANIVAWCCCSQGICKIKCYFEKNAFAIGETAKITCEIDNTQCRTNVNRIEARLINKITYTDDSGQQMREDLLVVTKSFGGVAAGQTAIGNNARHETVVMQGMHAQKGSKIYPSTTGKYIKSEYILQVEAIVEANCICCGTIPQVQTPVNIYPQAMPVLQFQIPYNWAPQQMPVFNIPFNVQQQVMNTAQQAMNMAYAPMGNPYQQQPNQL